MKMIVDAWRSKIKAAEEKKRKEFDDMADECMAFFTGPYNWMYARQGGDTAHLARFGDDEIPQPSMKVTINKAAEVVGLFGPLLYQRNPTRRVIARQDFMPPIEYFGNPLDPVTQQIYMTLRANIDSGRARDETRALLGQGYLNYTPVETNLRDSSRKVVDQALITGMGVWWCEVQTLPTGQKVVGNFYDNANNLLLDPDAEVIDDCMWIGRRCIHPVWQVEDEYGWERGSLKANGMSSNSQTTTEAVDPYAKDSNRRGKSNDLLVYHKIYSKMGIGGRLKDILRDNAGPSPEYTNLLDEIFGDNCFLAICNSCDYPLNLGPQILEQDPSVGRERAEWPIPFWLDNEWPATMLSFHWKPGRLYPVSHLEPALGELEVINWVYSFLTGKIRTSCRDIIVMLKSLSEDVKNSIKHGPDYSVIELEAMNQDISKMVQFLQHPPFNPEIYRVLEHMIGLFDKRTGLTELMYGQSQASLRSATEAQIKKDQINVRPEDMADVVEEQSSLLARKELMAARWALEPEDVAPALGKLGAVLWKNEMLTIDPREIFHQFECNVAAGSSRRPNKEREAATMETAMTNFLQLLYTYFQGTADPGPVNALIAQWAETHDLNAERFLMKPPAPPPVMPGQPSGQPSANGQPKPSANGSPKKETANAA